MTTAPSDYTGQLEAAARFIHEQDHFLVLAHVFPDGDAFGSTYAMGHILHRLNKSFVLANEDEMPQKFAYLHDEFPLVRADSIQDIPQNVICLDCADFSRLGAISQRLPEHCNLLNIDHHPTNDHYGDVPLIRTDASATAEIIYDLVEHMQMPWSKPLATAVYTGMLTDTGGFRYANTTPALLHKASTLLQYGVEANKLAYELLEKRSKAHIELLKRSLPTLAFEQEGSICWMIVRAKDMQETKANPEDLDGLIQYPRNIEGVEVGILFKQMDDETVKVSLRSADRVNVSAVAARLGGGGHRNASGVTMHGSLDDIVEQVIAELKREF